MRQISFTLIGKSELLQHNERLANPMDPIVKQISAISKRRNKSDDDFEALAKLEFTGGLYMNDVGPCIMGVTVMRAILDSSKKEKLGQVVKSYVQPAEMSFDLVYKGPRTAEELWAKGFYDQRMVKVQASRTLRTRPKFPRGWSSVVTFFYDPEYIDAGQLERFMMRAGSAGIGDYRPVFGKFDAEIVAKSDKAA